MQAVLHALVMYVTLLLVFLLCQSISADSVGYTEHGSGSEDSADVNDRALFKPDPTCVPPEIPTNNCSSYLWRTNRNSTDCECGDMLHGIIMCNKTSTKIGVLQCYCIYNDTNQYVGSCLYGCFTGWQLHISYNLSKTVSSSDILNRPCENGNRTGPLCGQCQSSSDHGISAYSFSLKCRKCVFSWKSVVKYVAAAYGPLTLFFVIIVCLTVSVNSAPLHGYIFVAQMIATTTVLRFLQTLNEINDPKKLQSDSIAFAATVYGIWNLDFFRFSNSHYCLSPSLSTLSVISLDFLIAAYPIVIIAITYTMVVWHGRGCNTLVCLWRPFICCFARFRQKLNIRTSIVDAFGTFFNLSYVKFLSTTIDLMVPVSVWDVDGTPQKLRVYYDGQLTFMEGQHLPYAIIALCCFAVFNAIPIIFLLVYPRQFFQERLSVGLKQIIHPFMDTLLGIYKDGTNGGYDCRFFVVVYPIARIAILCMFMVAQNSFCFILITVVATITAILVAVLKPYKSSAYNTVDTILVTILALVYAALGAFFFANSISSQQLVLARGLLISFIPLPFFYACGLTMYRVWTSCKLKRRFVRVVQVIFLCFGKMYLYFSLKINKRQEMQTYPSLSERSLLLQQNST